MIANGIIKQMIRYLTSKKKLSAMFKLMR
jgi:hypothetical protein